MEDGLRKMAAVFRKTPLHPQWFAFLREERNLERSCASLTGLMSPGFWISSGVASSALTSRCT